MVLHNMLMTHQGTADRIPTRANDIVALQNEQVVYVANDNYWSPSREAKHQEDLSQNPSAKMSKILRPQSISDFLRSNFIWPKFHFGCLA